MPSTALPSESSCTVAMADAVTAGWRVYGLVTPVPSFNRVVRCAASARPTYVSPTRCWESTNTMPSQPAASARSARAPANWGMGTEGVQSSTKLLFLALLGHPQLLGEGLQERPGDHCVLLHEGAEVPVRQTLADEVGGGRDRR